MLQLHLIDVESYDFVNTIILAMGETKEELAKDIWESLHIKNHMYCIEGILDFIEDLSIYENNKLKRIHL